MSDRTSEPFIHDSQNSNFFTAKHPPKLVLRCKRQCFACFGELRHGRATRRTLRISRDQHEPNASIFASLFDGTPTDKRSARTHRTSQKRAEPTGRCRNDLRDHIGQLSLDWSFRRACETATKRPLKALATRMHPSSAPFIRTSEIDDRASGTLAVIDENEAQQLEARVSQRYAFCTPHAHACPVRRPNGGAARVPLRMLGSLLRFAAHHV